MVYKFYSSLSYVRQNPLAHIREAFIQEVMKLEGGEFDVDKIDMDSITFESELT